jgi:hypothetical protein
MTLHFYQCIADVSEEFFRLWERNGNEVLKPLMRDPRWNEIVLLAAGRFGDTSQYQATS